MAVRLVCGPCCRGPPPRSPGRGPPCRARGRWRRAPRRRQASRPRPRRRLHRDRGGAILDLDPRDLGRELELHALLAEDALELLADLAVHARQDAVEVLDHGDLRAARRRQTEPSSRPMTPAPRMRSLPGTFSRVSAPVEETTIFSSMDAGEFRHVRTRGDDDVLGLKELVAAVLREHLDAAGAGEPGGAAIRIDAVLLEQELDALGVAVDAVLLERPSSSSGRVPARSRSRPCRRSACRPPRTLRRVQQGLGRDASDIEAGAAMGRPLLPPPRRSSGRAERPGWRRHSRRGRCR